MENQIKITITGPKSAKRDIARIILWAINKREEYQEKTIVFNIEKEHPATSTADIIIQTIPNDEDL